MEFQSREEVITGLMKAMPSIIDKYDVEEIGVYEEEGEGDKYYMGYTVRKDGHVYMINTPYEKNEKKELVQVEEVWTIQEENGETKGYNSLEEVFEKIDDINALH